MDACRPGRLVMLRRVVVLRTLRTGGQDGTNADGAPCQEGAQRLGQVERGPVDPVELERAVRAGRVHHPSREAALAVYIACSLTSRQTSTPGDHRRDPRPVGGSPELGEQFRRPAGCEALLQPGPAFTGCHFVTSGLVWDVGF